MTFLIESKSLIRAENIRHAMKWDKLDREKKNTNLNKLLASYGRSLNLSSGRMLGIKRV